MSESEVDFESEPFNAVNQIVKVNDSLAALEQLEAGAKLAKRWNMAIYQIMFSSTFPQDWVEFGNGDKAMMCMKSAAAERIGRNPQLGISLKADKYQKEEWTDDAGKAYRYDFTGTVKMGNHEMPVIGSYSTRDAFLGKANGEWKDSLEINENNIRNAAYHVFCGNGVKAILGLRGIPKSEWESMMKELGIETKVTGGKATFAQGAKGGTSEGDTGKQNELKELLALIASSGFVVDFKDGKHFVKPSDNAAKYVDKAVEHSLKSITSFMGKNRETGEPETVSGVGNVANLKDKRLDVTLGKLKTLWSEYQKGNGQ